MRGIDILDMVLLTTGQWKIIIIAFNVVSHPTAHRWCHGIETDQRLHEIALGSNMTYKMGKEELSWNYVGRENCKDLTHHLT